jgi:hypothetical protein
MASAAGRAARASASTRVGWLLGPAAKGCALPTAAWARPPRARWLGARWAGPARGMPGAWDASALVHAVEMGQGGDCVGGEAGPRGEVREWAGEGGPRAQTTGEGRWAALALAQESRPAWERLGWVFPFSLSLIPSSSTNSQMRRIHNKQIHQSKEISTLA